MPKIHLFAGIFLMKEWTPAIVSPARRSFLCKASVTARTTEPCPTSPSRTSTTQLCCFSSAPTGRQIIKGKWSRATLWLLPLLHIFLVASAMASHEVSNSATKGAQLRALLLKALSAPEPCEALADAVKEGGVRVLAVDFDKTMITEHTGGSARDTSQNPIFTALSNDFDAFAAAANSRGIQIAVVTFGDPNAFGGPPGTIAGEALVRRVLEKSAASFTVEGVFPFYPPFYSSPEAYRALGLQEPMPYNKSFHIRRLREQFGVSTEEVLLIDDDRNNCEHFVAEGGVSLFVAGGQGFDITKLEVL